MSAAPRRSTTGRARAWRRLIVRLIAVFSCLVALAGIVGSYAAYQRVSGAERAAQEQLRQISADFDQVSATLTTVSTSSANASTSVGEAQSALNDTSKTTRDIAGVLDRTAGVINFTIPGLNYQPLAGVDTSFRDQARQLRDVATQVDRTSGAMSQNGQDLRAISADVATISREMQSIATQLRDVSAGPTSPLATITGGTRVVILWTGTIHVLLLALGVALYLLTIEDRPEPEERRPSKLAPEATDKPLRW